MLWYWNNKSRHWLIDTNEFWFKTSMTISIFLRNDNPDFCEVMLSKIVFSCFGFDFVPLLLYCSIDVIDICVCTIVLFYWCDWLLCLYYCIVLLMWLTFVSVLLFCSIDVIDFCVCTIVLFYWCDWLLCLYYCIVLLMWLTFVSVLLFCSIDVIDFCVCTIVLACNCAFIVALFCSFFCFINVLDLCVCSILCVYYCFVYLFDL